MASKSCVFRFGDVEVREREFTLTKAGEILPVEPKAFRVLLLLLRNPQKLIAKEELLNAVWGDAAVTENSLTRSIALLRKMLGDDTRSPRYIETVATVGYRFVCKVEVSEEGILDPTDQPSANGSSVGASAAAEKETDLRRLARDLNPGLASVSSVSVAGSVATTKVRRGRWRVAMLAGAAGLVLVLAFAYVLRPTVPPPRVTRIKQITHDGLPKMFSGFFLLDPMATDGLRVYFQLPSSTDAPLMQVSIDGGESVRVPVPFPLEWLDGLSPSKSDFLLGGPPKNPAMSLVGLWQMPVLGGQARRIGNLTTGDATWAPDGASIYYAVRQDIWVARSDGSHARKILTTNGGPNWIRFSPDGKLFRFSVLDEKLNTSTLWEARADGTGVRRLFSGEAWPNECCGAWTSDGRYFIFESMRGGAWNLWTTREKRDWWQKTNPEPVQLLTGAKITHSPLPSLDGKSIFFIGSTPRDELERFDKGKQLFVPYLPGLSVESLEFSRDGSRLAYVTLPEGDLWQSKADGSDRRELTFPPMEVEIPRWSPDGKQIVFSARQPGKTSKVYIIPAEGGNPEQVTQGEQDDSDAVWSPNGDAIAFGGTSAMAITAKKHPIQILDLKTRELTSLPDSGAYFSPRWSPDGRWMLAIDPTTWILKLYDFKTRGWEDLTKLPTGYPIWTEDSQCIIFNNTNDSKPAEYRICLKDRKPQLLVDMTQFGPVGLGTFGWTGVSPDGSILAVRDISVEEIFSVELDLP